LKQDIEETKMIEQQGEIQSQIRKLKIKQKAEDIRKMIREG